MVLGLLWEYVLIMTLLGVSDKNATYICKSQSENLLAYEAGKPSPGYQGLDDDYLPSQPTDKLWPPPPQPCHRPQLCSIATPILWHPCLIGKESTSSAFRGHLVTSQHLLLAPTSRDESEWWTREKCGSRVPFVWKFGRVCEPRPVMPRVLNSPVD